METSTYNKEIYYFISFVFIFYEDLTNKLFLLFFYSN